MMLIPSAISLIFSSTHFYHASLHLLISRPVLSCGASVIRTHSFRFHYLTLPSGRGQFTEYLSLGCSTVEAVPG